MKIFRLVGFLLAISATALAGPPAQIHPVSPSLGVNAFTGTQTINPPYAGSGTLSSTLCSNSPSPISLVNHCWGYGTSSPETGQLELTAIVPNNNVLAIENDSLVGLANITSRGADIFYPNPTLTCSIRNGSNSVTCGSSVGAIGSKYVVTGTGIPTGTVTTAGSGTTTISISNKATADNDSAALTFSLIFEHMAYGWESENTNSDQIEFSTFDGLANPLLPPTEGHITQTGGIDRSGGLGGTCSVTLNLTTITCTGNMGTNGQLISPGNTFTGPSLQLPTVSGIQPATTLVSGGGTTSGVMSKPAIATVTNNSVVFTTPLYGSYNAIRFTRGGAVAFDDWNHVEYITMDRIHDRFGINNTGPHSTLDVVGQMYLGNSNTGRTGNDVEPLSIVDTTNADIILTLVGTSAVKLRLNDATNFQFIDTGHSNVVPLDIHVDGTKEVDLNGPVIVSGIGADTGKTDATVCEDTTTHQLYSGTGTLGICLGTSSLRYKRDWKPLGEGLTTVMAMKPGNYFYKLGYGDNGTREQYGFLAEDLVTVLPELTGLDAEGNPNSVDILGMVPVIVKAIQQQNAKFNEQQLEITGLLVWCLLLTARLTFRHRRN